MAFLRSNQNAAPTYTGLQLQTAVSTLPIPIVYGQSKVSGNVIWYNNFQSTSSGGGKGLGANPNDVAYTVDVMIGLCEGPITTIGNTWIGQETYDINNDFISALLTGTSPQDVWAYLADNYPYQALSYQGTAIACTETMPLDSSGSVQNHTYEIVGILAGTAPNGFDADPALVIQDFLTSPQYGAGLASAAIDTTSLLTQYDGDGSAQSYWQAMGIGFSPALTSQEQASSILTRWLQILNCAAVWSEGKLKFIPYGDTAIVAGTHSIVTTETQVPIDGQNIRVCIPAQWVSDGGVSYAFNGEPLVYDAGGELPSEMGHYAIGPAGNYLFYGPNDGTVGGDMGLAVVITFTIQTLASFTPNLTPVYALDDVDFIDEKNGKDPVQASRVDPFSLSTVQSIECLSRDDEYSLTPITARDQSQIDIYGTRVGSVITAHEICDSDTIGPIVAQLILQRQLYVRANFTFKLSWLYCLLDPMDIVEISDTNLGLNSYPVRITSVEEDDTGLLTVTAEELTVGVHHPALNPHASQYGYRINRARAAAPVNPPLIYEPPTGITGGVPELWLGASGSFNGKAADPNWGGAYVFLSLDDTTYDLYATIKRPMRQGVLTAGIPKSTPSFDTADTLSVSLLMSNGTLNGTSQTGAKNGATYSLVDRELLSYETATLTGAYAYGLTNIQRGMHGTTAAAHAAGAPFWRLDGAILKTTLPPHLVGKTIYLKFQSFNVFKGGVQSLADCAAYAYTPGGAGAAHPVSKQLLAIVALDLGSTGDAPAVADDLGKTLGDAPVTIVDLGVTPSNVIAQQLLSGVAVDLGGAAPAPTVFDDFGLTTDAVADVINLGVT